MTLPSFESIKVERMKNPTTAEIDDAVDVLLQGFGDNDRMFQSSVGGDDSLKAPFFRASICCALTDGEIWFAREHYSSGENTWDDIVGVAIWFAPGKEIFARREDKVMFDEAFFSKLSSEAREWWKSDYLPLFAQLSDEALGPRGKLNSWYLQLIAVAPKAQKRGIATKLVESVSRQASGSVLSVTAANEMNEIIYNRIGFKTNAR